MTHANAAAMLRNGHMSFKNENPAAYGIDLSSARVRQGRTLFEGVRNGQPVGALLGYQFERGLHEGHPTVSGLDKLRFTIRNLFPLVANKSNDDPTAPASRSPRATSSTARCSCARTTPAPSSSAATASRRSPPRRVRR